MNDFWRDLPKTCPSCDQPLEIREIATCEVEGELSWSPASGYVEYSGHQDVLNHTAREQHVICADCRERLPDDIQTHVAGQLGWEGSDEQGVADEARRVQGRIESLEHQVRDLAEHLAQESALLNHQVAYTSVADDDWTMDVVQRLGTVSETEMALEVALADLLRLTLYMRMIGEE